MPTLLLGAAGLSQKDVALSRRAEEQLEQERRDAELAARLQEEDEEAGKLTIKNVVSDAKNVCCLIGGGYNF